MKKIAKSYFDRTHRKWKIFGDSLLLIGAFLTETMLSQISASVSVGAMPSSELLLWTRVAIGVTIAGKFITNMFKEESNEMSPPSTPSI